MPGFRLPLDILDTSRLESKAIPGLSYEIDPLDYQTRIDLVADIRKLQDPVLNALIKDKFQQIAERFATEDEWDLIEPFIADDPPKARSRATDEEREALAAVESRGRLDDEEYAGMVDQQTKGILEQQFVYLIHGVSRFVFLMDEGSEEEAVPAFATCTTFRDSAEEPGRREMVINLRQLEKRQRIPHLNKLGKDTGALASEVLRVTSMTEEDEKNSESSSSANGPPSSLADGSSQSPDDVD